jgi:hypothetical protein
MSPISILELYQPAAGPEDSAILINKYRDQSAVEPAASDRQIHSVYILPLTHVLVVLSFEFDGDRSITYWHYKL